MKTIRLTLLPLALALLAIGLRAAPTFDSATVSFIQHDVAVAELDVLEMDADGKIARRPATLNEAIAQNQAVLTGRKSRAELKLNDGTIARVGQLSSFTYGKGTRDLQLKQGSALFVVPKGLGGTRVQAGPVTAAITGTTLLVQVFADRVLIYVYEGSVEVAGQSVTAGQVITIPNGGSATLVAFDVNRGLETAALFSKFIEADSQAEIMRLIATQLAAAGAGIVPPDTNLGDRTILNPRLNSEPSKREPEYPNEYYYPPTTPTNPTPPDSPNDPVSA